MILSTDMIKSILEQIKSKHTAAIISKKPTKTVDYLEHKIAYIPQQRQMSRILNYVDISQELHNP